MKICENHLRSLYSRFFVSGIIIIFLLETSTNISTGINLKLAIDEGLSKHQSDLISSFMQTLVMSEGDKWVWSQVNTIALALNAGEEGQPVALAGSVVRSFATKRLGKADLIASLED
jgi:hypothetical protein